MTREEFIDRCKRSDGSPPCIRYLISGLELLKNEFYPEPQSNWPDDIFRKRCFQRWAIDEVKDRILTDPFLNPAEIARSFLEEVSELKNMTNIPERYSTFLAAQEAAEDVYDWLRDTQ